MKKTLSLLLTLCLLLGVLPTQALALAGDILLASNGAVQQRTLSSGSLALQNDYLRVIARKDGTLSTAPAADSADPTDRQTPFCEFVTYGSNHVTHPASLRLKSLKFVDRTPNGQAKAVQAEYDLTVDLAKLTVSGTTSVYYEIVQLKEEAASGNGTWGVLVSVDNVKINEQDSEKFFQTLNTDVGVFWGYTLDGFTGMGHRNAADSPVIKMNHTVYDYDTDAVLSTENSLITGKVANISTEESFSHGGNWCYDYITEVYTDGYTWANPFVGLSTYYSKSSIKAYLPDTVSVTPANRPGDTRVECVNDIGLRFKDDTTGENSQRFLWGFRNLVAGEDQVPTAPDTVDPTIYAKRLAVFAVNGGVTVEYVADDAALSALKKQYGNPVAIINGDYESQNGTEFTFTGGAALLSPSVAATWGAGGKLVIHNDGRVEQQGVSLNAPSFKFYQPNSSEGKDLEIALTKDGFTFAIDPGKNEAIVYVDIPYAAVKLEQATADTAGNLVFGGNIGFQTLFSGAEFSMEKLGYGLNEKNEFKVNGVKATGSFDTAKLMALELASVEGEVNTFKGQEKYAFKLELNVFDLFETEAKLALERSKKDGSLIPDELWFYVKAEPGIPLIPPIPIGQLNGGGAGFKDLAATVNGDYFAIPPLKLRGALTGTYLHLIQGTGNVVLGPSEILLKATDVGLVGLGKAGQIIDSFGYSLQLNGQERTYGNETYKGIYFGGSEELKLNLPNKTIDVIEVNSSVKLGAFGGVNDGKNEVYLGIGANGTVTGRVQIPSDIPVAGGFGADVGNINLIIGGQTTFPITGVSVSEGMKQAFENVDIYLGAMVGVDLLIVDTRAWVLIPNIIKTNFRRGEGWGIEYRWLKKLPEWDWSKKGVAIVTQEMPLEDGGEEVPVLYSAEEPMLLENGGVNTQTIKVDAGTDETPYILLAFDSSVTEQQIKDALFVTKENSTDHLNLYWVNETEDKDQKGHIDRNADINAATDILINEDKNSYRVAILRLKEGGTYQVNTGSLMPVTKKTKGFAVEPFEKLELTLNGNLFGQIKYAGEGTKYVLRTYLGTKAGGADYLIDERTVENPANISVGIPTVGTLAPTGDYYVTSFLMTEKSTTVTEASGETKIVTGLVGIDSQTLGTISYTNTQQPDAPASVSLELAGNEVMTAKWDAVDGADGYAVTIYQLGDKGWIDTGFGYDLKNTEDGPITSIDMALTVGGAGTEESQNLSAEKTYKVGVRAYKLIPTGLEEPESTNTEGENTANVNEAFKGAKYYSAERESNAERLPEYKPLNISLYMNSEECAKDEKGVFRAYVGSSQSNMLAVRCDTAGVTYNVTQMDTSAEINANSDGEYQIPDFTGTLMLKIDGISGPDVTSVFLLVSRDETPPVLTLSDPIFYADTDSGEYKITGTADAGSQILYRDNDGEKSVYAAGDGSFTINGMLDERENSVSLYLRAQDSAGNLSKQQLALVARQAATYSVTVNGSYAESSGAGNYTANSTVTVRAWTRSGFTFNGWTSDSGVTFADASAEETTFTMPDRNVTVTANWVSSGGSFGDSSTPAYPVSTPDKIENGSIIVSPKSASKGNIVTITVKPDDGFKLGDLTVTDKSGNELKLTDKGGGKYTFTMPSSRVEVKATFVKESKVSPFGDVATDAYYYEAVKWAQENGITDGIGNGLFGPDQPCTRAQIVTFLWRAAGSPEPKAMSSFTDVLSDAYYAKAVAWAIENGITTGTGDGKFSPDATCTRAQAVTFLFRISKASADGTPAFSDVATDAYYAEAVKWATDNGITNGISGGLFGPDNNCTRAQIVTFLWRLYAGK